MESLALGTLKRILNDLDVSYTARADAAVSGVGVVTLTAPDNPYRLLSDVRAALHDSAPSRWSAVYAGGADAIFAHQDAARAAPSPASSLEQGRWVHGALTRGSSLSDILAGEELRAPMEGNVGSVRLDMNDAQLSEVHSPRPLPTLKAAPLGLVDPMTGETKEAVTLAIFEHPQDWSAPAYLGFGGYTDNPAPGEHVGLLHRWSDIWGAQVVCVSSEGIDVAVHRTPKTTRRAATLAQEHLDYCPYVVEQGVNNLMQLAATLREAKLWSFQWT